MSQVTLSAVKGFAKPKVVFVFAPTGATSYSPGLPLRLPWETRQKQFLNRNAVASFSAGDHKAGNRVAVG
jgi:hypothetical protein